MTMRTTARLFSVALLSLSLITGCASTGDAESVSAEQAIAEAKTANAAAKAANYEWRDTGKMIEEAEAKLAAGDEEGAIALANTAKAQAENAKKLSGTDDAALRNQLSKEIELANNDIALLEKSVSEKQSQFEAVQASVKVMETKVAALRESATKLESDTSKAKSELTAKTAAAKHAEAFEICEYGAQPNEAEIRRLFPMLIK